MHAGRQRVGKGITGPGINQDLVVGKDVLGMRPAVKVQPVVRADKQ